MCKKITSQLISAMGKQEDVSVQLEALDILSDMLGRTGSVPEQDQQITTRLSNSDDGDVFMDCCVCFCLLAG